jgi:hypothetical protein
MVLRFAAALAIALCATAAVADAPRETRAEFDLVLKGIRAGTLSLAAVEDGRRYTVTGRLATSGLAAVLKRVRYAGEVAGRIRDGRFLPQRYAETADTGRRQSEAVLEYRDGVPQVKVYAPPRAPGPDDPDPAAQGGSVDPLTALFATLRDVPPGEECRVDLALFDGRRASRVALGPPVAAEGGVACAGEYRRVAGFPAEDMAERTRFAFALRYAPGPEGRMRVVEVTMETLVGKASMIRR